MDKDGERAEQDNETDTLIEKDPVTIPKEHVLGTSMKDLIPAVEIEGADVELITAPEDDEPQEISDDDEGDVNNGDDDACVVLSSGDEEEGSDGDIMITGVTGMEGEEQWRNVHEPIRFLNSLMAYNRDPAGVLTDVFHVRPSRIPATPMGQWSMLFQILSEPQPRKKLDTVNTLENVLQLLDKSQKIVVLSGAGISVSCGIPDFRSRDGVYARLAVDFPDLANPQAMFDLNYFKTNPQPFFKFAKEIYPGQFTPSMGHRFIRSLESRGKLLRNYTQNIDTLEQVAGITRVIQCHGSFITASCMECKHQVDGKEIRDDVMSQVVPRCPVCPADSPMGIMKPDIVFFGEALPNTFHSTIARDKDAVDLLIVIGSSLKVRPVAHIPNTIPGNVPQILINREILSSNCFDVELLGDGDVILEELARRLGYTEMYESSNDAPASGDGHDVPPKEHDTGDVNLSDPKQSEESVRDDKTADQDSKTADQDSKTADQDSKTADQDFKTADQDSKTADQDSKTADQDFKTADQDSKTADQEPAATAKNSESVKDNVTKAKEPCDICCAATSKKPESESAVEEISSKEKDDDTASSSVTTDKELAQVASTEDDGSSEKVVEKVTPGDADSVPSTSQAFSKVFQAGRFTEINCTELMQKITDCENSESRKIASYLPPRKFGFLPPNTYIFPGAEYSLNDSSPADTGSHCSTSSEVATTLSDEDDDLEENDDVMVMGESQCPIVCGDSDEEDILRDNQVEVIMTRRSNEREVTGSGKRRRRWSPHSSDNVVLEVSSGTEDDSCRRSPAKRARTAAAVDVEEQEDPGIIEVVEGKNESTLAVRQSGVTASSQHQSVSKTTTVMKETTTFANGARETTTMVAKEVTTTTVKSVATAAVGVLARNEAAGADTAVTDASKEAGNVL